MKKQLLFFLLVISNLCMALEIPNLASLCKIDAYKSNHAPWYVFDVMSRYLVTLPLEQIEPTLTKWYTENPDLFMLSDTLATEPVDTNPVDGDLLLQSFYQSIRSSITVLTEQESNKICDKQETMMMILQAYEQTEHYKSSGADETLNSICDVFGEKLYKYIGTKTYTEVCCIWFRAITQHCPKKHPGKYTDEEIKKYQEIIRVLNNLGVEQSCSDEQLDLFAQLQALLLFPPIKPLYIKETNMLIIDAEMDASLIETIRIMKKLIATYEN